MCLLYAGVWIPFPLCSISGSLCGLYFHLSFSISSFPWSFKQAQVSPVFKNWQNPFQQYISHQTCPYFLPPFLHSQAPWESCLHPASCHALFPFISHLLYPEFCYHQVFEDLLNVAKTTWLPCRINVLQTSACLTLLHLLMLLLTPNSWNSVFFVSMIRMSPGFIPTYLALFPISCKSKLPFHYSLWLFLYSRLPSLGFIPSPLCSFYAPGVMFTYILITPKSLSPI